MILGLPQWWGPALMVPGFVLLALAGLYMAGRHLAAAAAAGEAGASDEPEAGAAGEGR
jgi:TRAP-type mannitol/chloroaromatic compound transport system permease small subunit